MCMLVCIDVYESYNLNKKNYNPHNIFPTYKMISQYKMFIMCDVNKVLSFP